MLHPSVASPTQAITLPPPTTTTATAAETTTLPSLKLNTSSKKRNNDGHAMSSETVNKKLRLHYFVTRCEVCDIQFTDTKSHEEHMTGQRHSKRMQQSSTISTQDLDDTTSSSQCDGLIVREIQAHGEPLSLVTYVVECYTGDKIGAGTDADVFLTVFGERGDTGQRSISDSFTNLIKFERGQIDVFKLETVSLGRLEKIRIGHNGKLPGAGWYLTKVVVREEANDAMKETFECNRWLATDVDDGLIVRELFPASIGSQANAYKLQQMATTSNRLKVNTGDKRGVGTDAGQLASTDEDQQEKVNNLFFHI